MRAALCLDDQNGLSFNHRRLSRDRAQQEDLLTLAGGAPMWVRPCSAALFSWAGDQVRAAEELPAAPGALSFLEDCLPPLGQVEELILYRWNRTYPADIHFDWDLSLFTLTDRREFPGTSHETITREIYRRKGI